MVSFRNRSSTGASSVEWASRRGCLPHELGKVHGGYLVDRRSDEGGVIFRMTDFQAHAAADEAMFQHGAAPCGAFDNDQDWLGAEFRMAGDHRPALATDHDCISTVLGLDAQHALRRKIVEKDATFDLRLDHVPVHLIAEVGVRREELRNGSHSRYS